jgi:hypothetical protein
VFCPRMYGKGIFVVKLCAVSAGKANPILKAAVLLEKMLPPNFLCGEESLGLNALRQYAGVRTEVIRDVFSVLF